MDRQARRRRKHRERDRDRFELIVERIVDVSTPLIRIERPPLEHDPSHARLIERRLCNILSTIPVIEDKRPHSTNTVPIDAHHAPLDRLTSSRWMDGITSAHGAPFGITDRQGRDSTTRRATPQNRTHLDLEQKITTRKSSRIEIGAIWRSDT
jgi:hypothetical protein